MKTTDTAFVLVALGTTALLGCGGIGDVGGTSGGAARQKAAGSAGTYLVKFGEYKVNQKVWSQQAFGLIGLPNMYAAIAIGGINNTHLCELIAWDVENRTGIAKTYEGKFPHEKPLSYTRDRITAGMCVVVRQSTWPSPIDLPIAWGFKRFSDSELNGKPIDFAKSLASRFWIAAGGTTPSPDTWDPSDTAFERLEITFIGSDSVDPAAATDIGCGPGVKEGDIDDRHECANGGERTCVLRSPDLQKEGDATHVWGCALLHEEPETPSCSVDNQLLDDGTCGACGIRKCFAQSGGGFTTKCQPKSGHDCPGSTTCQDVDNDGLFECDDPPPPAAPSCSVDNQLLDDGTCGACGIKKCFAQSGGGFTTKCQPKSGYDCPGSTICQDVDKDSLFECDDPPEVPAAGPPAHPHCKEDGDQYDDSTCDHRCGKRVCTLSADRKSWSTPCSTDCPPEEPAPITPTAPAGGGSEVQNGVTDCTAYGKKNSSGQEYWRCGTQGSLGPVIQVCRGQGTDKNNSYPCVAGTTCFFYTAMRIAGCNGFHGYADNLADAVQRATGALPQSTGAFIPLDDTASVDVAGGCAMAAGSSAMAHLTMLLLLCGLLVLSRRR